METMKRFFLYIYLVVLFSGAAVEGVSGAEDEERILSFDSHITVHGDSSLTVEETIRVLSNGQEIKHGIFRDFPTIYRDRLWNRSKRGFSVKKVLRDGNAEKFIYERIDNGDRVRIGDAGVLITPGEHTYTIIYKTSRQLGYFRDHDELYWNVTGNGWQFPIDKAAATVELPEGAEGKVLSVDGYTGLQGAKDRNFIVSTDSSGRRGFLTRAPLGKFEGLTIVVSWPKGFVRMPSQRDRMVYFMRDNRDVVWGLIGLMVAAAYYLIVWFMVGRDPKRGVIVPLYGPPQGLSPASMRYIMKMGYDDKVFSAAVINLAVKGILRIKEANGIYTLTRTKEDTNDLSPEEHTISATLLDSSRSLRLSTENYGKINKAVGDLKDLLKAKLRKDSFITNRPYFIAGLVLSLLCVFYSIVREDGYNIVQIPVIVLFASLFTGISVVGLKKSRSSRKEEAGRQGVMASLRMGCDSLMAVGYIMLLIAAIGGGLYGLSVTTTPLYALIFMGFPSLSYLFHQLLKAHTRTGGLVFDKIEGFRTFLAATEADRLDRMNPPERTPELFERFLPYALALDVEQQWAEQFTDIFTGTTYEPEWYSGTMWSSSNIYVFSSTLGSSLAGGISSSSIAPGTSSGSGGGGSSGGGGGGGGGGGW
jgi:uncharacterized membrane protein YgcG